ncbi:signal-regulatory protein beta-1-like isoform X1 [Huso huso]|uniref:Signal-regulatory protein beta-1-like isoform X1 n=2 Tax=Huso huso TaxID=61971 RepID=A0ABR0YG05_HUSHU
MLHIFITVTLCLKVYRGEGALLHQTPAQQFAAAGDLVETFCSSSACVVDTDLLRWFMKKDSEVIALNTSCKAGPGCRVTTRRASNGDCGLTIRGVQPVDSGVYYCAEYSSNALEFSNGSLLTVRDNSTQNTTVTVMGPSVSGSALDSKGTLTFVCLVRGLSSPALRVQWFFSGHLAEGGAPSSWIEGQKGGDGESYSATSWLAVPAETWRSGAVCACAAQLNSNTVIRSRDISYPEYTRPQSTQTSRPEDCEQRAQEDPVTYARLEFTHQKKPRRGRHNKRYSR